MLTRISADALELLIDLALKHHLPNKERTYILAKSSPGCKTLAEEWTIVLILVNSAHAIEDSLVDLGISLALKLDCRQGSS